MQSLRGRPPPTASPGADVDGKPIVMLNFDRRVSPGSVGCVCQSADAYRVDARRKPKEKFRLGVGNGRRAEPAQDIYWIPGQAPANKRSAYPRGSLSPTKPYIEALDKN